MTRCLIAHATHPDAGQALALCAAQLDGQIAALSQGLGPAQATGPTGATAATDPAAPAAPSATTPAPPPPSTPAAKPARRRAAAAAVRPAPAFTPTLGLAYLTDAYADRADELLDELRRRWPGTHWAGCSAVGVAATGVEYIDEPALVIMLTDLPRGDFTLFHGGQPLAAGQAHSALVHADPMATDLAELVDELSGRTGSGYLFGGLSSAPQQRVLLADGVWGGGLSGVGFGPGAGIVSRVTQGCQPIGPTRRITAADGNLVKRLDGQPALPLLLADLGVSMERPTEAIAALRRTLAGITDADDQALARAGQFGTDTRVRHLVGIAPDDDAVALADTVEPGQHLTFCHRDVRAARRDLVRICAELRDAVEPGDWPETAAGAPDPLDLASLNLPGFQPGSAAGTAAGSATGEPASKPASRPASNAAGSPASNPVDGAAASAAGVATPADRPAATRIAGAVYISCSGRGGPHFGAPSAELQIVQHALGEVPLVGFFAAGEIAHRHLYGYTGVLTLFTSHD